MAIRLLSFSSPHVQILAQNSAKVVTRSRLMMCATNSVSVRIRSYDLIKNKVFEDRSAGIVCYKDENGEITCEGYDEGPRFHQKISRFSCNSRDVEIVDLLQRCWIHVYDENEMETTDKEISDFNCNGVNKLC
ncbi:hypothetical protein ACS0TY_035501 [Phlomoides rotata]